MCKLNFCHSCVILKLNCIVTRGINSVLQNFSYQKSNHRIQILAKTLLILWLCSDSCHTRGVPGQKWPDSKQLLINLSLCYIITKYWIHSFCQLVFFNLGLVLCFYLHLINRKPHLSESRYLVFWVKKAFFMNKFHNMRLKIMKICSVSHTSVL